MGSLTDYSENELLDHVFNASYSAPANLYLCLCTADPTDAATGAAMNEAADANSYARTEITFDAAATRKVDQSAAVEFPQASGSWGTITHWAIADNSTHGSGNVLAHGAFTSSFAPVNGNTPTVAAEIYVQIDATESANGTGMSTYLVHKLLDLMFNGTAYTSPADSIYLALSTTELDDDDADGADFTECSGTGYTRELVMSNGSSLTPTWDLAASGVVDNTHTITFGPPSAADWGTIVAIVILDGDSLGNILFYDNDNVTDQAPGSGDTVQIAAGACDITMT